MGLQETILLLWAFLFLCSAPFVYVLFRFAALVLTVDSQLLRELQLFRLQIAQLRQANNQNLTPQPGTKTDPTDGAFEPMSDFDAWRMEQEKKAQNGTMTQEDIESFIRQATGAETE